MNHGAISQEACLPLLVTSCNAHSLDIFVLIYRGKDVFSAEIKTEADNRAEYLAYSLLNLLKDVCPPVWSTVVCDHYFLQLRLFLKVVLLLLAWRQPSSLRGEVK